MDYLRLTLAALGGTVASFAVGSLLFVLAPGLIQEAHKYPAVFRSKEEMMPIMPVGLISTLAANLIVAVLFAMIHPAGTGSVGSGVMEGLRYGALIGLFVVFGFVLHNYVNLKIGPKLALMQAAAYFVQWAMVGVVMGLIY